MPNTTNGRVLRVAALLVMGLSVGVAAQAQSPYPSDASQNARDGYSQRDTRDYRDPRDARDARGRRGASSEVDSVVFGKNGMRRGEFRKTGRRQWEEIDGAGRTKYRFEELRGDDSIIYLADRSRGVNLELDLRARKVMFSDQRTQRHAMYDILMAGDANSGGGYGQGQDRDRDRDRVSARNVQSVVFGDGNQRRGEFRKTGRRQWDELDASGRIKYTFDEVRRDEYSVYLENRERRVSLQLDLRSGKVMFSENNSRPRPMYDVLDAN
ncbi:MAG: hypothetical protein V4857_28575 [Pseudomonadota bacterium]